MADPCQLCRATDCDNEKVCADECGLPVEHIERVYAPERRCWRDTFVCGCSRYDAYDVAVVRSNHGQPDVTRVADRTRVQGRVVNVETIAFHAGTLVSTGGESMGCYLIMDVRQLDGPPLLVHLPHEYAVHVCQQMRRALDYLDELARTGKRPPLPLD